jgi:toxin ParE1/3/4
LAYKAGIIQSAQITANFPSMGRPYTTKNGKVFQKYNVGEHALFYRPTETGILIVRVLHLKMDFDRHID